MPIQSRSDGAIEIEIELDGVIVRERDGADAAHLATRCMDRLNDLPASQYAPVD